MKKGDENKKLEALLADKTVELDLAADGINEQWKIIGNDTKNGKF